MYCFNREQKSKTNLEKYEFYTSVNFLDYEFYSRGPKGVIRKIVRYRQLFSDNTSYFNLGFGDWNEYENRINDFVATNNGDSEKVLVTVAYTVVQFTEYYPDAIMYAEGSTPSRTRLYQMGINKFWNEIEQDFNLYGFIKVKAYLTLNETGITKHL